MKRTYLRPISKVYNINMTSHILDGSKDAENVGGDPTTNPGGGSAFDGGGSGSGSTGTEDGARYGGGSIWDQQW